MAQEIREKDYKSVLQRLAVIGLVTFITTWMFCAGLDL